jgi:hypothetical protein
VHKKIEKSELPSDLICVENKLFLELKAMEFFGHNLFHVVIAKHQG